MQLTNRISTRVPAHVMESLSRVRGRYSDMVSVFYCVQLSETHWVGVAGDGDNGSYEWFSAQGENLECSDVGYGDTCIALRDVLKKFAP